MNIGFIGLGQMGRGMASRLLDCGFSVSVWNRSPAATESFRTRGATVAKTPGELLGTDVVITMLADDAAVEAVWLTPGLVERMPASGVHLNMASIGLQMGKVLMERHHAAATQYVSAPVFGRPEPAAAGQLDIVAAGAQPAIERCAPVFEALGRKWFNVGTEAHQANIVKIARNLLLGTVIESLGEAFALVQKSGIAPQAFLDIITSTAMNSPAYKNYGRMIIEGPAQSTFPLKLGMKDVELALQAGRETLVPLPMAALMHEQHLAAIARGYGEKDWAALGNYIAETAGL